MNIKRRIDPSCQASAGSASCARVSLPFGTAGLKACRFPFRGSALGFGPVQGHGGTNEGLQRLPVYLIALVEVDGAPRVPLQAGVEEARTILQSRPFGEGHLHDLLVGLAGTDQAVVRPHRD